MANIFRLGAPISVLVWLAIISCGSAETETQIPERTAEDFLASIQGMERELAEFDQVNNEAVGDLRRSLMVAYGDFSRMHGGHPEIPEMLFRRADLLIQAEKYEDAVLQLQDVHDGYPTFDKQAWCALLMAFVYEEKLKDRELAIRSYERVMALHPDSPEADMAEQLLDRLRKLPGTSIEVRVD